MLQRALLPGLILICSFVAALVAGAPTRVVCSELQHRFAEPKGPLPPISGIIALGGAHARIVTALQLAAAHPESKLVITGASMEDEAFARRFEPRTAQLLIEPLAKSTFENALFTRQLVSPKPDERWVIVTSAIHMPRAIGAFREAGFKAVAWPIYDLAGTGSAIGQATWHEVFGLLEYWASEESILSFRRPFLEGELPRYRLKVGRQAPVLLLHHLVMVIDLFPPARRQRKNQF